MAIPLPSKLWRSLLGKNTSLRDGDGQDLYSPEKDQSRRDECGLETGYLSDQGAGHQLTQPVGAGT